jgi:hypothetical protein
MLAQRVFEGAPATSAPFPVLETTNPCEPEKAIFSPVLPVNCPGAAALLSISPCCPSAEKSSARFFAAMKMAPLLGGGGARGGGHGIKLRGQPPPDPLLIKEGSHPEHFHAKW